MAADKPLPDRRAAWPTKLLELGKSLQAVPRLQQSSRERGEFWNLLHLVLRQRIRRESYRLGPIGSEDILDLASQKALDLMNKLDAGQWNLEMASRARLIAFVSTVARNGLIDFLRTAEHRAGVPLTPENPEPMERNRELRHTEDPGTAVERVRFVGALLECVGVLQPIHRKIWFLRIILEMPTAAISRHPEVQLNTGNIDVIQQRCRIKIRECMRGKGLSPADMPQGTFTELWLSFDGRLP